MRLFDVKQQGVLCLSSRLGAALMATLSLALVPATQAHEEGVAGHTGKVTARVLDQLRANPASSKSILVENKIAWCGTMEAYYKNNPAARAAVRAGVCKVDGPPDNPAVRNAAIPNASTPFKTIRVVIHVFTKDDGSAPTATPATVRGAMEQLNSDYAPSRIRFVLTETLTHRSTKYREPPKFPGTTEESLSQVSEFIKQAKAIYAKDPLNQLNAYVFELGTAAPTLLGEGTFPSDPDALGPKGGFYCDNDAFGKGALTATHEFGHNLGLYHPFRGVDEVGDDGCGGCRELAGRSEAEGDVTGDFCSDTPPTPTNFLCGPPVQGAPEKPDPEPPSDERVSGSPSTRAPGDPAVDPCNGKPFGTTDFRNFMAYGADPCPNHFTPQQNGRMHAWIDYRLKTWLVADTPSALPTITSTAPTGRVITSLPDITATFSEAMNRASVQAAFSLAPSVAGTFTWSADSKTVTFKPSAALASGTTYTARILGSAKNAAGKTLDGNRNGKADSAAVDAVSWSFTVAGGPANDTFARAQVLVGVTGRVAGTTLEASKERGEPNHGGDLGGASIWYRWTAPSTGNVTFSTISTRFDTTLGAYSGTSVSALRTLASNNNSANASTSTVTFPVTAGQVIYIAIDGARDKVSMLPASGPTHLFWSLLVPPSNDNVASAQLIRGGAGSVRGTTVGATVEANETSPLNVAGAVAVNSVWYRWTAPTTGNYSFKTSTEVRDWDTTLGVYEGVGSSRKLVAANDNSGTLKTSAVVFSAVAGKEYFIVVDGAQSAGPLSYGIFGLRWAPVPSQPTS